MGETLTIQNFGPIVNMTLELRVVNILIGDQGTGKSTVAKLLAAIKMVVLFPERTSIINGRGKIDPFETEKIVEKR
jgi:predicted ATPase